MQNSARTSWAKEEKRPPPPRQLPQGGDPSILDAVLHLRKYYDRLGEQRRILHNFHLHGDQQNLNIQHQWVQSKGR